MSVTLFSCSDANDVNDESIAPNQQSFDSNAGKSNTQQLDDTERVNQPLLTLGELLGAADVKLALAKAADEGNMPILKYWQNQLLTAAEEVNLTNDEVMLISGPQGLKYLEFQGMKTNYHHAFDEAFFNFQDVDAVYNAFPAFENLHERSRELVAQRDQLIQKVASELESSGFEGDAIDEARIQWQNFVLSNAETEETESISNP